MRRFSHLLALMLLWTGLNYAANYQLAENQPDGYPTTLADYEFARLVEERTDGRIQIKVFPGGSLFLDESDSLEAVIDGELAFTRVSSSPVSGFVPIINAIQLPHLYKSREHMWAVLNGEIGQGLLDELENSGSGLVGLCYYDAGSRCFYFNREVRSIDDMSGLRIRLQNNPLMIRMISLLGAIGITNISMSDTKSAIESGRIDGAENNWPTYQSHRHYDAAKYYVLNHHTRIPEILVMSKAVKDTLAPEDFAIIKQCARESQDFQLRQWAEMEREAERIVRSAGVTVIELTPEALAEFHQAVQPLYKEYGNMFSGVVEMIQAFGE